MKLGWNHLAVVVLIGIFCVIIASDDLYDTDARFGKLRFSPQALEGSDLPDEPVGVVTSSENVNANDCSADEECFVSNLRAGGDVATSRLVIDSKGGKDIMPIFQATVSPISYYGYDLFAEASLKAGQGYYGLLSSSIGYEFYPSTQSRDSFGDKIFISKVDSFPKSSAESINRMNSIKIENPISRSYSSAYSQPEASLEIGVGEGVRSSGIDWGFSMSGQEDGVQFGSGWDLTEGGFVLLADENRGVFSIANYGQDGFFSYDSDSGRYSGANAYGIYSSGLSGEGNAYSCIDSGGHLYRSETPCNGEIGGSQPLTMLSDNGYFETGGMLIQWGKTGPKTTTADTVYKVNFVKPFSVVYNMQCNVKIEPWAGNKDTFCQVVNFTTSYANIAKQSSYSGSSSAADIYWVAIGKA